MSALFNIITIRKGTQIYSFVRGGRTFQCLFIPRERLHLMETEMKLVEPEACEREALTLI